jgi:hypothetical protein
MLYRCNSPRVRDAARTMIWYEWTNELNNGRRVLTGREIRSPPHERGVVHARTTRNRRLAPGSVGWEHERERVRERENVVSCAAYYSDARWPPPRPVPENVSKSGSPTCHPPTRRLIFIILFQVRVRVHTHVRTGPVFMVLARTSPPARPAR